MKNLALDYYRHQPSYCLMVAPKVHNMVLKMWLEGFDLSAVAEAVLNDEIGRQSIVRFKSYVCNVTTATEAYINSEEVTRSIIMGFLSYVEEIYNDLEDKHNFSRQAAELAIEDTKH